MDFGDDFAYLLRSNLISTTSPTHYPNEIKSEHAVQEKEVGFCGSASIVFTIGQEHSLPIPSPLFEEQARFPVYIVPAK